MDRFQTELGSLRFRNLAVVLQPKLQKAIKIDELNMNRSGSGFAPSFLREST